MIPQRDHLGGSDDSSLDDSLDLAGEDRYADFARWIDAQLVLFDARFKGQGLPSASIYRMALRDAGRRIR
jgi:hypothetical protein